MTDAWHQNSYRIRKKSLALGSQYWIEDSGGQVLGFSKAKLLKLKEDIRVYSDENMNNELFRIQQQQMVDAWGGFAVVDTSTKDVLGYIKRKALMSGFVKDKWEVQDANRQPIGKIEESTGLGLVRKYLPGGGLIPGEMTLQMDGKTVAEIKQQFKIIGDIWELKCVAVPPQLDRRTLISCLLLMGMVERARK